MDKNQRIEVIDVLRGLSCFGILLYHVRIDLWVGWWHITSHSQEYSSFAKAMAWLSIPAPFLGYSILLFFLISGFCIHYPNTISSTRPLWKTYLKGRFWRIYPTYLIAVIFTSLISYYCHTQWDDRTWSFERIFRVLTVSQNYPPGNSQFLSNPSLWTIPLEIEFYILYPLAFNFLSRFKFSHLLFLAVLISGISIFLSNQNKNWISFTAFFFWPSWLLGAWIATHYRRKNLLKLKNFSVYFPLILFLVIALISRMQKWESWMQHACWTGFYLFLMITFLRYEKHLKQGFNLIFRIFAWLGKISYSLYLIHFPLFKLLGYLHIEAFGEKPANFFITLLYLIPVIFVAWLFFKYVEYPIHKWSKNRKTIT